MLQLIFIIISLNNKAFFFFFCSMCRLAYPVKKSLTWKVSCLYLMSIYTFTLFGILFVITAHTIERILSDLKF